VLIGGPPSSGKSTLARTLAAQLGYQVIATDDLGAAARGVTGPEAAPDLFAMRDDSYQHYYVKYTVAEQLDHALRAHRALWPAIESVIHEHATWAPPCIIEGWALLPELVAGVRGATAVWLEVPEPAIVARVTANKAFHAGAPDPELLIGQFSRRSVEFGRWLGERTAALQLPLVRLTGSEPPDEVARNVLDVVGGS